MAEEIKKETTTKKRTTSKPKVEEPKPLSIEEQMAQMMAMMMTQQQQFQQQFQQQQQMMMSILQGQQVPVQVNEVEEEEQIETKQVEEDKQGKEPSKTKQDLRRKYKDKDIYVMNTTQGAVSYKGRNMRYSWDSYGDIEPMSIDDVVNMPKGFLNAPCLLIDEHENGKEVKQEIENVLGIKDVDGYMELINRIEMTGFKDVEKGYDKKNIVDHIEDVIKKAKKRGCDLTLDLAILVQHKIDRKELNDYHIIGQLSKLLGRKFL